MQNEYRARLRNSALPLAISAAIALGSLGGCGIKGPLKLPPPAPGSPPASSSGATASPSAAPTPPPEAMPAEPPATPAQPADQRKP